MLCTIILLRSVGIFVIAVLFYCCLLCIWKSNTYKQDPRVGSWLWAWMKTLFSCIYWHFFTLCLLFWSFLMFWGFVSLPRAIRMQELCLSCYLFSSYESSSSISNSTQTQGQAIYEAVQVIAADGRPVRKNHFGLLSTIVLHLPLSRLEKELEDTADKAVWQGTEWWPREPCILIYFTLSGVLLLKAGSIWYGISNTQTYTNCCMVHMKARVVQWFGSQTYCHVSHYPLFPQPVSLLLLHYPQP